MRHSLLVAGLLAVSCGSSKERHSRVDLCDVLETYATTSKSFRDNARADLAAMSEEVEKWRRYEQREFKPEEDASGDLTGAKQRVFAFHKTVLVWCQAAIKVRRDMATVANSSQLAELLSAANPLEDGDPYKCYSAETDTSAQSWDPSRRQKAAGDLTTWSSQATTEERTLVEACRAKVGQAK